MIGAFAFLIARTTRNKLLSQLRRLKSPRYAIGLVLGLAYFWFLFFNRSSRESRVPPPTELYDTFFTLLPLAVFLIAAYMWLFMKDRSALAFTQAEVSMLFTAPVSRRALILYKLARGQAAVLWTSLIWVLLLNHGNRAVEHALSYWLLLSTISMHRIGVALVRTSQAEHGTAGLRRTWPVMLVVVAITGSVAWGLIVRRDALLGAFDVSALGKVLISAVNAPPVSWALYPFRALVAPTFERGNATWVATLPAAFALFLIHVLWIVKMDTAFEEAAVEASARTAQRLAERRARGATSEQITAKAKKKSLRLSPVGPPAVALLWKNTLWLIRTGQVRALIGLPVLCIVLAVGFAGRSATAEVMVMVVCVSFSIITVMFAPMTMRNDLRGELARLAILKTMPLRGREILMAEVASSALPTAVMQILLVIGAMIAGSYLPRHPIPLYVRLGVIFGAPLALVGLSLANFTIHNGMALMFPAWVKTGDTGVSGIETMGQSMLTMIVTLVMLAVLLIVPAIGGAIGYFTLRGVPSVAIVAAGSAAGILLAFESYAVMNMLGGQLDKLEPSQVG